ncbi:hypothetical protein R5R35_007937 [Gryllus longicercus]|uniref:Uncharacterized protein n=1 Tax=Gryllus longicercus TaxID=2509291 RepID=A0AAN9V7R6_9ORTH
MRASPGSALLVGWADFPALRYISNGCPAPSTKAAATMATSFPAVLLKTFLLMTLLGLVVTQYRSGYLPKRPVVYPRFLGDEDATIDNRFGGAATTDGSLIQDQDIPKGYDPQMWRTVASWPKDKQPYWFVNAKRPNADK